MRIHIHISSKCLTVSLLMKMVSGGIRYGLVDVPLKRMASVGTDYLYVYRLSIALPPPKMDLLLDAAKKHLA